MKQVNKYIAASIIGACVIGCANVISFHNQYVEQLFSTAFTPSTQTAAIAGANSGLVARYTFDEGSGTTAGDSAGSNTGRLFGGPTWIPEGKAFTADGTKIGGALSFDGVDDYVEIPDSASFRPGNGSWSVALWVRNTGADQKAALVSKVLPSGTNEQWSVRICGTSCGLVGQSLAGYFRENGAIKRMYRTNGGFLNAGWHHVAMVADKSADKVILYVDGHSVGTSVLDTGGSWPTVDNTDVVRIASGNDGTFFKGEIDDVHIFNRAIDPADVVDLFTLSGIQPRDPPVEPNRGGGGGGGGGTQIPTGTISPTSGSITYYVSPNGNDLNAGTQSAPLKTIQLCANVTREGNTCLVQAGTYNERVRTVSDGSNGKPITFKAQGTVVTQGFHILNDYIIVDGFEVTGDIVGFVGSIEASPTASKGQILNNNIHDLPTGVRGIILRADSEDFLVKGNKIYNSGSTGIDLNGEGHVIESNRIEYPLGDGLRIFGSNQKVLNNHLVHIDSRVGGGHVDVMQTWGLNGNYAEDIEFAYNFIENSTGQMGQLEADGSSRVKNWHIHNNVYYKVHGMLQVIMPASRIENNVFYNSGWGGAHPVAISEDPDGGPVPHNTLIRHNIFIGNGLGDGAYDTRGWYNVDADALSTLVHTKNYVSGLAPGYARKVTNCAGKTYAGFDFCDTTSINGGNPMLRDVTKPAGANGIMFDADDGFKPLPGSPLCGAGVNGTTIGVYSCNPSTVFESLGPEVSFNPIPSSGSGAGTTEPTTPTGPAKPVLHFDFEKDWTSNGQLEDVSDNNNNATCQKSFSPNDEPSRGVITADQCPSSTSDAGAGSKAAQFIGARCMLPSDYFAVPISSSINNLTSGSVAIWVKYNSPNDPMFKVPRHSLYSQKLLDTTTMGENNTWQMGRLYGKSTSVQVSSDTGSEVTLVTFPDPDASETWNHYVFTWDGSKVKGYFNGALIADRSYSGISKLRLSQYLAIGALKHNFRRNTQTNNCNLYYEDAIAYHGYGPDQKYVFPNDSFFVGKMDDLRIYNKALTESEVAAIYGKQVSQNQAVVRTPITPVSSGGNIPNTPSTPNNQASSGSSGGGAPTATTPDRSSGNSVNSGGGRNRNNNTGNNSAATPAQSNASAPKLLTAPRTFGSSHEEIKKLQVFLNKNGYVIATTGAGSPGRETNYFGPATLKALNRFQIAKRLSSRTLDVATMTLVNSLQPVSTTTPATMPTLPLTGTFTRTLSLGMSGDDVKALQIFLNTKGFTIALTGPGSKGNETTFFGAGTKAALIRFQESYRADILTPNGLTKGTGTFGPSTIRKVNELK